ncbi:MAG: GNAT family N-acetyltransferase [Bosea sp. (in: a-proteobacteria)]
MRFTPPPLRPVTDADGAGLARLIAACFAEYEGCFYEPAEFPELIAPATHYTARGAELWVMGDGLRILASVAITPVANQRACEITKVYLDAGLRGSGAGEALMAHASARAASLGWPDMVLWTDTRFARAHRFYEKLGFMKCPVIRYLADVSASWEYRYEKRAVAPVAKGDVPA